MQEKCGGVPAVTRREKSSIAFPESVDFLGVIVRPRQIEAPAVGPVHRQVGAERKVPLLVALFSAGMFAQLPVTPEAVINPCGAGSFFSHACAATVRR
jgi:hypothetical protein